MTPMRILALIGTVLLVALPAGLASAQSQTAPSQDVQVTSEAIARTCSEIHKNPGAQADGPGIGPGGNLVINCRLLGPGGIVLGQVSPEEVCQRLTGSIEWYRGMGTQVYCRIATATAPAPAPAARSFTINEEDIARACQKIHRNPQATALPPKLGPSGLELGCRLVNESGVTLAQVTPEDVCETKFGVRDWVGVAGSPTFVCKGNSTVLPNKPPAGQQDGTAAAPPSGPPNDVPLVPEAIATGCRSLYGQDATAAATSRNPASRNALEIVVNCNTGVKVVGLPIGEFCPHVSGTPDWYLTDFGRGTWMPGEPPGAAPRIHVCRGKGPLEYPALADIGRYCKTRGYDIGNFGIMAAKAPVCANISNPAPVPADIGDVCHKMHRASTYAVRGTVYFCLPERTPSVASTPAPSAAPAAASAAASCPDCGPLEASIARYKKLIATQDLRVAQEEADRRALEAEAKRLTGRSREEWQEMIRSAGERISGMKELRTRWLESVLRNRERQLIERRGRCTATECSNVATQAQPVTKAPPPNGCSIGRPRTRAGQARRTAATGVSAEGEACLRPAGISASDNARLQGLLRIVGRNPFL